MLPNTYLPCNNGSRDPVHSSGLCGYVMYGYACRQNTHTYFLKDLKKGKREGIRGGGIGEKRKERERKQKPSMVAPLVNPSTGEAE